MPKNRSGGKPTPPRRLVEKIDEAYRLLEDGRASDALAILIELDGVYPNQPDVLGNLLNAYYDLHDMRGYEYAARRLVKLDPRNPDLVLASGSAFMKNLRPILALRAFQDFLRRWTDDPRVGEARQNISQLERIIREQIQETGLPDEQARDLLLQQEEMRYFLDHGLLQQGRQAAEKLLRRFPDFIPALNNLSQIYAVEGDFARGIELSQRVLGIQPDNIHALSNLARLFFLRGRPEDAAGYAERLKKSNAAASDRWMKIAEALTFLGEDESVLALYEQAKRAGELEPHAANEIFYHLLGAAAQRLGREQEARRFWQKALEIDPNYKWSQANLDDLEKPEDERSGPWAFPFDHWLLGSTAQDIARALERQKDARDLNAIQKTMRLYMEQHPALVFLAPHLLERGDDTAREFVFNLAASSGHAQIVEQVKAFVFGKQGSFKLRMHGAQLLSEADLLPSGPVRFWTGGEWQDILLLNFEISSNPVETNLPKKAKELFVQAYEAMYEGDGKRAQVLLEEALAIHPDDPSMLFNLASTYQMQGKIEQGKEMIREIHRRFPDYFFGIASEARYAIEAGNFEWAHDLLNELMQRKQMHVSEFGMLCICQIEVWLGEGKPEGAQTWLDMLEKVDSKNPNLPALRSQIGKLAQKKLGALR